MALREYLDEALQEYLRRLRSVEFELGVNEGYVKSAEADPADIDQIKCQLELNLIEREYLQKALAALEQWRSAAGSPDHDADPGQARRTSGGG